MSTSIPGFHAVVPAGGAGTRLWPLSRAGHPKFLIDLTGSGRTLLQATVDRLLPLTGEGGVLVVTGARHAETVAAQVPELGTADVLAEPSPRDSMAAIGLAAAVLLERHGEDVVLGSFAADHVIHGTEAFERAVREGVVAAHAGYVVTIGITATGPSTAFGYVRSGASLGLDEAPSVAHAEGFAEKPDAVTASAYLATGEYRWNAGMFIVRARVLLDHLAAQLPPLAAGLREIAAAWDGPERAEVLDRVWPGLTKIAIDHAIAEPVAAAGGVAVVPGDFTWDDIGDFDSLAHLLTGDTLGDDDLTLRIDAPGAFVVPGGGRTVSVVGLPDAVVVDTPDAVLVTTLAHAQAVKSAVDGWRARGREDLL
ncbi:mannose-1-phosphate guanylyltransferase [Cellulomonas fengjieae]|uniref:Mannose-1-phosphate guanylyltransferase n=1 Tax=Cellulomonas fengjieae TaxID=2819978 RepID=A0ABS3SL24_9CELL|nr:mannose-1-phosphate guanylyltransferase [Cellulomonas fengjieae]MBO3086425.1 mannose-1-phosphate guanylyltransferase [Cellulomonas fengjieae]MBO3100421.1 mannose-1-phosphate guanylyltransferase [Cellulomonas fengjieae]QVI66709.1 mannose-1-phosphate guanylyltransferase [Cellulomonas fengjieae]